MNTYNAVLGLRAVRQFTDQPISDETLTPILDAGRWTGSAKNTQPWQFIVVRSQETRDRLANCGKFASHIRNAALAVAVLSRTGYWAGFDAGRAAQNMMVAAWADGIGSCIASLHDEECARKVLQVPDEWHARFAISFGYPDTEASPTIEGRPRDEVLASVGRRPLEEIVHREQFEG